MDQKPKHEGKISASASSNNAAAPDDKKAPPPDNKVKLNGIVSMFDKDEEEDISMDEVVQFLSTLDWSKKNGDEKGLKLE